MDADVGIVGLGAMGSLCAWELASRGAAVLAWERFTPGHDRGSSHGDSRLIRTAYFEGAGYVPLVQRAFALWRRLEAESGSDLLQMTGGLMLGPAAGGLVSGAVRSAKANQLQYRRLDAADVHREYPQHRLLPGEVAVCEAQAGFLRPEAAVRAAAAVAAGRGARLLNESRVAEVVARPGEVRVRTAASEEFGVGRLVVAAGAWTKKLLPTLRLPLRVERQVMAWFAVPDPDPFAPERFPVFMHELAGGRFRYGVPSTDGRSVKVAAHHEGREADPDRLNRRVHAADLDPLREFCRRHLAGVSDEVVGARVCMYTNAPGDRFIVAAPESLPEVTVVSACSGHGFKFAPAIGEVTADWVLEGRRPPDVIQSTL